MADYSLGIIRGQPANKQEVNKSDVLMGSITGASGNVTQTTSNNTAVTTTARAGIITMVSAIAASNSATFTMNNVNILPTSNVVAWTNGVAGTDSKPGYCTVSSITNGSCAITVVNGSLSNNMSSVQKVWYLIL